jgi:hypothetical protein
MQYARYLLPMTPFLGLCGGEGVSRIARGSRILSGLAAAAVSLQAGLTLVHFGRHLPERLNIATNLEAREKYLTSSVNAYAAEQWINRSTRPNDGVVLFEETRGFYLDRPYLWGNGPHSLFIPYQLFANGQDMARWFVHKGYRYAIVNLQFSPPGQTNESNQQMAESITVGTEAALIRDWYADPGRLEEIRSHYNDPRSAEYAPNRYRDVYWRLLLGDAVANGGAVVRSDASSRGTIVLEFRPAG